MSRNILKWVLIAAVVLGAAAYLILSETPSKKKAPRPKGQKEQIVIKEGHSKAFTIEPIEGITISAPENALDKDREFKITPVAEKSRKKMEKELAAVSFEQPLFAFDMNSGQLEDELFPGVFTCQIDLKKMGIPENLYDYIHIWRYDGEQLTKYTSWVQNGKLVFRSDHNGGWMPTLAIPSAKAVAMTAGTALLIAGAGFYLYHTWVKHSATGDLYKNFFMSNDDAAMYPVWDSYGNFEIHFRFKDTEWADKHDEYVYYNEASYKRLLELYEQAQKDYHNHKTIESLSKIKLLPQLFKDEKDCEQSKEVITLSSILVDLCEKDSLYQEYNKKKMPPPSIVEIGEFLKLSNRYLTDNQHLKPQSINLEVNLVDGKHITGDAEYRHPGIKNAYMLVNFDHMWTNGREKYVREGMAENVLIDINHELFHHREKIMKWMDLRTEETMAAYNEYHAAKYFFEKRETTSEIPRSPSDRTHYEYYGRNFNKNSTDAEVGYVYADFMDSLQLYTRRGSVFVRGDSLIGRYGYFSSHKSNYMKWFNIKDEKTFDDYLKRFCMNSFPKIAKEQAKPEIVQAGELGAQSIIVSKSSPMAKVTTAKESLIMRDVEVDFDIKHRKDGSFNAFVIRDKDATEDVLAFCWCKSDFSDLHTKDSYMHSETGEGGYRLGYFKHLSGKYKFTIVALFAPDAPDITKVKDDHISFILTKPSRDLTKNKLVTGAVVTYTDKNGNTQTLDVNPKQFGKRVKWPVANASKKGNAFTLTAHWYYKPDDQTTYVSPESKMAEWGGHLDEQEKPQAEEKAPETNYWKLVNVRMEKTNTSYKESQNPDEEVDADYRSIYFAVDRTEKSCTFMGIAATEEVHEDNTHHYVRDLYLDGTLTFTEPPKFWTPGRQYKAICEVADDPYLLKISEPFVFEAENSSSQPTVCLQSKNDKIDNGWSSLGETNWLRSASTTFEAHSPEKDSPKFFTLTQSYSIAERPYSDLMAKVVLHYDYEWVGEPEEEEKEEETAPEGGCWKLVKIETDDSHKHFKAEDIYGDKNRTTATISGGSGSYSMHVDWWGALTNGKQFTGENGFIFKIDRQFHGGTPKQYYTPGKNFNLSWVSEELMVESLIKEMPFNAKSFDHYPNGSLSLLGYDSYLLRKTNNRIACDAKHTPDRMEMNLGVVPAKEAYPKGFVICEVVVLDYPSAAAPGCYINNYYIYEWVDGEQKEEDLGNLGIGIEFPMNARDKAYFGEHGGSLLHRNDFGVRIPSGSYSVKKSGKGYILEGSGHHEGSRPRASHSIEVRIELDKNKIPVEASFSCQGFYEGTIRTMKTETTTFQATGTAKLTEKELGPNSRMGKCTSFNGIIHTESEGDFDYSNTEGGHLTIRWKCD